MKSKNNVFITSALFSISVSILPMNLSAATAAEDKAKTDAVAQFNGACYLKRYPDLDAGWVKKGLPLLLHFKRHGYAEKRKPGCDVVAPVVVKPPVVVTPPVVVKPPAVVTPPVSTNPEFNETCYLKRYPDVVAAWTSKGLKAIDHYNIHGKKENRKPGCDVVKPAPVIIPPVVVTPAPVVDKIENTNTIKGTGALPISITVNNLQYGGAVDSLKYNGKEFINRYDHGRQLQSAMQVDGFGECNNPTEAGSEHDYKNATSTSKVLSAKSIVTENRIKTKSKMAYWTYKKTTGACKKGMDARLTSPLSEHVFEKDIQIGFNDDDHIIKYSVSFTHPEGSFKESLVYEFLTGYLNSEFNRFYYVGLADESLNEYGTDDLTSLQNNGFPVGSFYGSPKNKKPYDPIIFSTADGKNAMGVYTSKKAITDCKSSFHGYNVYKFALGGSGPVGNATNKWSLAVGDLATSKCIVNNTRKFDVYIAIGDVYEVHKKLLDLSKQIP